MFAFARWPGINSSIKSSEAVFLGWYQDFDVTIFLNTDTYCAICDTDGRIRSYELKFLSDKF